MYTPDILYILNLCKQYIYIISQKMKIDRSYLNGYLLILRIILQLMLVYVISSNYSVDIISFK